MLSQFPEFNEDIPTEALPVHQRLLADGEAWRAVVHPSESLPAFVIQTAQEASAPPPTAQRNLTMSAHAAPAPVARTRWVAFVSLAAVALLIVASLALFRAVHQAKISPATSLPTNQCTNHQHLFDYMQLSKIAMVSPTEGWAAGNLLDPQNSRPMQGTIWHYKNCQWQQVRLNFSLAHIQLTNITMLSADDGWISGSTLTSNLSAQQLVFLHDNHGVWERVQLPDAPSNIGSFTPYSDAEGWLVGEKIYEDPKNGPIICCGQILHQQGSTWNKLHVPASIANTTYESLDIVGANDIWFFADSPTSSPKDFSHIVHYHKGVFTTYPLPNNTYISAIQMVSATNGWAAGDNYGYGSDTRRSPVILHFDGLKWQSPTLDNPPDPNFADEFLTSVSMFAQDGWITGYSADAGAEIRNPVFYHCQITLCTRVDVALPGSQPGGTPIINGPNLVNTEDTQVTMVAPNDGWAVVTAWVVSPARGPQSADYHAYVFHYEGKAWTIAQQ